MKWSLQRRPILMPIPEVGERTPKALREMVYQMAASRILPIPSPVSTLELLFWGWRKEALKERRWLSALAGPLAHFGVPGPSWRRKETLNELAVRAALQDAGSQRRYSSRE